MNRDLAKLAALMAFGKRGDAHVFWAKSDMLLDDWHTAHAMAARLEREQQAHRALGLEE